MRRHVRTIKACIAIAAFAATLLPSWAEAQSLLRTQRIPSERTFNRMGLKRMWSEQAVINPSRDTVRHLVADEETVFVHSTAGTITALDAETGRRLWAVHLGRIDNVSYPAVTNSNLVLIAVGMKLYALERGNGDILWELDLDRHPSTSPAMDEVRLYIGSIDGSVYAYDLRKIGELYDNNLLPQWSTVAQSWRFRASKAITSAPISNGRVLTFASEDKSLYCITSDERDIAFQLETDQPVSTPITQRGDSLIFGSADLNVYKINMNNGRMRWRFVPGNLVTQKPQAIGEDVYVTTRYDGMYCLDDATGLVKWTNPQIAAYVSCGDTRLYVSDLHDNLMAIDRSDGVILDKISLPHFKNRLPNDRTDRIFMCTTTGLVLALREIKNDFPIYHQFPDNRPILPEFTPDGENADGEEGDEAMPAEEPSTDEETDSDSEAELDSDERANR